MLAPLVDPLFRIFGARTFPMAFPRGWSLVTQGFAEPRCWIDQDASWVSFENVCPTVSTHPMLAPTLVASLRAVVDSLEPGTRVWQQTSADTLTLGIHSAAIRAG